MEFIDMNSRQIIITAILSAFVAIPSCRLMGAEEPQDPVVFNDASHPLLGRSYRPQNPIIFDKLSFQTSDELFDYLCERHHPLDLCEELTQLARFLEDEASKQALLATGDRLLQYNVENRELGIGTDGTGKNRYGKILMRTRRSIRSEEITYVEGYGLATPVSCDDGILDATTVEQDPRYAKLLLRSARQGDLKGVQLALAQGISPLIDNTNIGNFPPEETGNTVFYTALLGASDGYERIRQQITTINKSRNQGLNKFVPASHFDEKIRRLGESRTQFDNLIRLIKIFNPNPSICNNKNEHLGDLLRQITNKYPASWQMLFEILLESQEQSLQALKQAGIIEFTQRNNQ